MLTAMDCFAPLPEPPYYAVIFSNRKAHDTRGYDEMAAAMTDLAQSQPGYIGIETASDGMGFTITVSYWRDEDALQSWKQVSEHLFAQKMGKQRWYQHYRLRVAKIERTYSGPEGR